MTRNLMLVALFLIPASLPGEEKRRTETPTDKAIEKALAYLATAQDTNDGAWRLSNGKNPAVTALAVMAFMSAGNVPGEGKYGEVVEKGIRYVLKQQKPNGLIAANGAQEMYHHGICTLMLAEAAGMTDGAFGKEIRKALEETVKLILTAQRTQGTAAGGWRYQVKSNDADMSVTGWQVMALRAAKNVGCDVPPAVIDKAVEYIKRSQDSNTGGFCYQPHSRVTVACTGTGILALELCGKNLHRGPEVLKAAAYLSKHPPIWNNEYFFYMIYYCTQAMFQLGDNYWDFYGPKVKDVLLSHQQSNGSWSGGGSDGGHGPAYCTSMAVLALTVEYRFLPIYQREEPREKK